MQRFQHYIHSLKLKNLERETESYRLERLKKLLQEKLALSERKRRLGGTEMSANR